MRITRNLYLSLAAAGIGVTAAGTTAAAQDPTIRKTFTMPHVLEVVGQAIDQPIPAGLSPADLKAWNAETAWLKTVRTRLTETGTRLGLLPAREASTGMATGRRKYQPLEISKEIDALRTAIEKEAIQYQLQSDILRTRHDACMNAIRNMRA